MENEAAMKALLQNMADTDSEDDQVTSDTSDNSDSSDKDTKKPDRSR